MFDQLQFRFVKIACLEHDVQKKEKRRTAIRLAFFTAFTDGEADKLGRKPILVFSTRCYIREGMIGRWLNHFKDGNKRTLQFSQVGFSDDGIFSNAKINLRILKIKGNFPTLWLKCL